MTHLIFIWALCILCVLVGFAVGFRLGENKGYSIGRMDGDYMHRQEKGL